MKSTILLVGTLCVLGSLAARADEGMWLFNQPPRELLRDRYEFELKDEWLLKVQRASIRFNSGGSGSFVSKDGLLVSNHHVGADALQKLSTKEKDYLRNGFYAAERGQEVKCLDLELNVLQSIEDVTEKVNAGVPARADNETAFAARRKIIAEIEKESLDRTGLRSDVVTLWKGGAYHLYTYKRYTDVRLVFAPEQQIAFFGGDPDNFEFPRYDLDICFFRAYEDGKPASVEHYLPFSKGGAGDGELVFVSGHPGRTSRLITVSEWQYHRDHLLPFRLQYLNLNEVMLSAWSERSEENARRAKDLLFGIQNARKAYNGRLAGLLDPELLKDKADAEENFKAKLSDSPEAATALKAYDTIRHTITSSASRLHRSLLLEGGWGFSSVSADIARTLLRAGDERAKPDGERLEEFSESSRQSLELNLFSEMPIYADLEVERLTAGLTFMAGEFGYQDRAVQIALAGKSPRQRAVELINGTKVRDLLIRKQLYEGGAEAVRAANDPLIELMRAIDPEARKLRSADEAASEALQQAHAAISRARNSVLGFVGYPDATFTLRLAFGKVAGYEENGATIPAFTTFQGLYERAQEMNQRPPFDLPRLWEKRKGRLDLRKPFNFVSTCDIIGGNSGSPVINRDGAFVGIIFDGNLASLPWDYKYSDLRGRATSVHSSGILESLDKIYGTRALLQELRGNGPRI